jgi:hypothetical protein
VIEGFHDQMRFEAQLIPLPGGEGRPESGKQQVSRIQNQEVFGLFSRLPDERRPSGKTAGPRFSSAEGLDGAVEVITVNEGE